MVLYISIGCHKLEVRTWTLFNVESLSTESATCTLNAIQSN